MNMDTGTPPRQSTRRNQASARITSITEDNINDVELPDEVSGEEGSYYEINYKYEIYEEELEWDLKFNLKTYIPFSPFTQNELNNIGEKGVSLRNYSRYNGSQNTSTNNIRQLTRRNITHQKIIDIHEIQKYITNLTTICSNTCDRYNRAWVCCGQFAPYMFIYHYFLYELKNNQGQHKNFRDFYSEIGGNPEFMKRQLYRMAVVFYKTFTGYGASDPYYRQVENSIPIPTIHRNSSYWLNNLHTNDLVSHKGYLFVLHDVSQPNTIYHFGFIYRVTNYVIICDSWKHEYGGRVPITRTIKYSEYLHIVNNINWLCDQIQINPNTEQQDELLIMYNYMMNSLFIIPYNYSEDYIRNYILTFPKDNLAKFYIVNPDVIDSVLDGLIQNNHLFDSYVALGGNANKKKNTKRTNKRNNKKRKTYRKNKSN